MTLEPGTYLWRSPLGYQYLRDHTGTLDVTPTTNRRRYARELIAHFDNALSRPAGDLSIAPRTRSSLHRTRV